MSGGATSPTARTTEISNSGCSERRERAGDRERQRVRREAETAQLKVQRAVAAAETVG